MNVQLTTTPAKDIFSNNRWQPGASGKTIQVIAPAEGRVFAEIAAGDTDDVKQAVAAARAASESGPWSRMSATERGRILSRIGPAIADHAEELAQLEARDTGKPMKQARNDMIATARYFEYYGRTVAAALAMGNACVVKPAENARLTPLFLAELAAGCGLPEGALNVVPGLGEEAGAALSSHPGIDFISFTVAAARNRAVPSARRVCRRGWRTYP